MMRASNLPFGVSGDGGDRFLGGEGVVLAFLGLLPEALGALRAGGEPVDPDGEG
jgi:hypothetical protein